MSDDMDRRQFLRRFVSDDDASNGETGASKESDDEGDKGDDDQGWKPGWQPKTEAQLNQNRSEVREQLGEIEEPDEEPFDALGFVAGLGAGDDDEQKEGGDEDERRSARRNSIPVHRPPRALAEPEFLEACTRCEACIEACPHDAIELAGPRFREAQGTPVINASEAPCYMCEDTPCVDACEPEALVDSMSLSMGDAQIQVHDCLAHQGSFCTTCSERCPMPGAIKIRDGKPTIRTAACTGCGVCHYVCPAPVNAVRLFPRGTPDM